MSKIQTILGTLILIAVIIATVLITKSIIEEDYDAKIEKLNQEDIKSLEKINKLTKALAENAKQRVRASERYDSLEFVAVQLTKNQVVLKKELKNVKGKYKDFSNDSLYKEVIRVYKMDSIARSN